MLWSTLALAALLCGLFLHSGWKPVLAVCAAVETYRLAADALHRARDRKRAASVAAAHASRPPAAATKPLDGDGGSSSSSSAGASASHEQRTPQPLRVCTYNLRFLVDRYPERYACMRDTMAREVADIYGLQECIVDGHLHRLRALAAAVRQAFRVRAARGSDAGMGGSANADTSVCAATSADRTFAMDAPVQVIAAPAPLSYLRSVAPLRAALSTPVARIALDVTAWLNVTLLERTFGANLMHVFDHWLGQYLYALLGAAWVFGNALLVRKARVVAVVERDVLLLGKWRVAQRALVVLANARRVWVLNMHLHDGASAERESLRGDQVAAVLAWMATREADADGGCVLLGDLNAAPHEKAHELLAAHGFASAHRTAHGAEPRMTFPLPLQASTKDVGAEQCDDYIYVKGRVRVNTDAFARGVRLIGDKPLPNDATLYPSDHIGIVADLIVD